jgi:hypothetical protein
MHQALQAEVHQTGEYPDAGKRSQDNKEGEESIGLQQSRGEKENEEGEEASRITAKCLGQAQSHSGV